MIYLLSTRGDLRFSVQKLANFSSNPGIVHFEGLVHLLRYIRENKTLGLKYIADMNDAPVYDILIQASIKTKNQLMVFSDYIWQYFPYNGRSTGAYIIFYHGGPIDHSTHVTGPVYQPSAESEHNAACSARMDLSHFRILIYEFLNKDPYIFLEEDPLIILDSNYVLCMANNGKDTKHKMHIARRVNSVRSG